MNIFFQEQEVVDVPDAIALEIDNKSVEFDNVHFSYQPEKPILKGISFRVNPGETVALVNIFEITVGLLQISTSVCLEKRFCHIDFS